MKVSELKKVLANLDDNADVVMSSDSEGNCISHLDEVGVEYGKVWLWPSDERLDEY